MVHPARTRDARPRRALHGILALVFALVLAGPVAPVAYACACGAMEPEDQKELGVDSESAAIMFDGATETIALSMGLSTDSPEVAFLMPLPVRAEARLGGQELFDQLYEHTKPVEVVEYDYWPGAPDGAGAVPGSGRTGGAVVVGRQRVGNYDVVQLTGEQRAVGQWLDDSGFRARPQVLDGLGDYLSEGWVVMAVKLAFESEFSGGMAPLVVTFPTTELVYPMMLSALAEGRQTLRFYVFAGHRQDLSIGDRQLQTTFAGWVDGPSLRDAGHDEVAELVGDRRWFLTRVDDTVQPSRITTDLQFTESAEGDTEYHRTTTRTVDRSWVTLLAIAGGLVVVIGGTTLAAVLVHRRARRDWQGAPPE